MCRCVKRVAMLRRLMLLLLLLLHIPCICAGADADDADVLPPCCSLVFGSCKEACENFSLFDYANNRSSLSSSSTRVASLISPALADIKRHCPPSQHAFWSCLRPGLEAADPARSWTERSCCRQGITALCRDACVAAGSEAEVRAVPQCRPSDEPALHACLERRVRAAECCGRARTGECMHYCQRVFATEGGGGEVARRSTEMDGNPCAGESTTSASGVMACMPEAGEAGGQSYRKYETCCSHATNDNCKQACHSALAENRSEQEIVRAMVAGGCGNVLPHDPLWKCFQHHALRAARPNAQPSRIKLVGMDAAKQLCCNQARDSKCRRQCMQTYTTDWTRVHERFEAECLGEAKEMAMRQCLEEVDEPCQPGCTSLTYCSHLTAHRPHQLYRSCTAAADRAARLDFGAWLADGHVNLTVTHIPLRNVSECLPHAWHTIACVLQTRPCTRRRHTTRLCRADCLNVLSRCLDVTRALPAGHSPESICAGISDAEGRGEPCFALGDFGQSMMTMTTRMDTTRTTLPQPSDPEIPAGVPDVATPNTAALATANATFPCAHHGCDNESICELLESGAPGYQCTPACRLGETSTFRTAVGRYVRVPAVSATAVASRLPVCHKVCRCGADGRLGDCVQMPCVELEACMIAGRVTSGRRIEHAATVRVECNVCSCYAGEMTCTKRQCRAPGTGATGAADDDDDSANDESAAAGGQRLASRQFNNLPCNCAARFMPVCGLNGQTYPSECVAQCAGLGKKEVEFGACATDDGDVCRRVQCPGYGRCVPVPQVCLTATHRPCEQFVCVNDSSDPTLLRSLSSLVCPETSNTDPSSLICGINGRTYPSECALLADHSWPDYAGRCREFGRLSELHSHTPHSPQKTPTKSACSAAIECPTPQRNCRIGNVLPPGACCPICAAAMRAVYSRKQLDRALSALPPADRHSLTLQRGVLAGMQRQLQATGCRVSGSLTVEGDIFVAVHSLRAAAATNEAAARAHEAVCARELDRLATLIDQQAAQIVSDVALSALIGVRIVQPMDAMAGEGDGGDHGGASDSGAGRLWTRSWGQFVVGAVILVLYLRKM